MWDVVGWGIIWSDQDLGCASSFGETQEAVRVRSAWNVSFCWSWKWRFTDVVEILGTVVRMGNFLFLPQAWLVCINERGRVLQTVTERDACEIDACEIWAMAYCGMLGIEVSFFHQKCSWSVVAAMVCGEVVALQILCLCSIRCNMMWLLAILASSIATRTWTRKKMRSELQQWRLVPDACFPTITYQWHANCRHRVPSPWNGQNTGIHRNIGTFLVYQPSTAWPGPQASFASCH